MELLKSMSVGLIIAIVSIAGSTESRSQPTSIGAAQTSSTPLPTTNVPQSVSIASVAQLLQALADVGVFIYVVVFAKDLRESIKGRHLDGMKYVREIISTPEAAELRRWVRQDLGSENRPLSSDAIEKVRRIGRDFDHIGLLCRKGLLPADIIATTYNRNITSMWSGLNQTIMELRINEGDDDYFAEFEWLDNLAIQNEAAHQALVRQARM